MIWERHQTAPVTYQLPHEPSGPGHPTQPMPAVPPAYGPGYPAGPPPRRPGRLGPGQKAALFVGTPVLALLLCCGGLVAIGSAADDPKKGTAGNSATDSRARGPEAADAATADSTTTPDSGTPGETAAPTGTTTTEPAPNPTTPSAGPKVEKRTTTETRSIPFGERTVKDPSLAKGTRKVRTKGVTGRKTLTYEVTYTNGVQTGKRLIDEEVTRKPVTQVVAVGTRETRNCDPNYSGCVPVASDVDCAGGSGNGPAYVQGPVRVIGSDIYDLDRDGDGYGCDD